MTDKLPTVEEAIALLGAASGFGEYLAARDTLIAAVRREQRERDAGVAKNCVVLVDIANGKRESIGSTREQIVAAILREEL